MTTKIKSLVTEIDMGTCSQSRGGCLYIIGPDSQYVRAIRRKADAMGICTDMATRADRGPTVIDVEHVNKRDYYIMNKYDIDAIYHSGLSCAAEAALLVIQRCHIPSATVAIIGHGHAVKGLDDALRAGSYTPLGPCHKQTRNIQAITAAADVIVNAADTPVDCCMADRLVIDISGTLQGVADKCSEYVSCTDVGGINTSLLLNRFAGRCK